MFGGNQLSLKNQLIFMLRSYLEYENISKNTSCLTTDSNGQKWVSMNPQNTPLDFRASFIIPGNLGPFCNYRINGEAKYIPVIGKVLTIQEIEEVIELLTQKISNTHNWEDILSRCYSIVYTNNGKKVLSLHKNKNVDITRSNIILDVDELHYSCGCVDECSCGYLNLPIISQKKFVFYNNGVPIDIPNKDFWRKYRSIEVKYTFCNKYVTPDIEPDYNKYIDDNFNKTSTPTGYFYRIDGDKILIVSFRNQNWPITTESAAELIKLGKKLVFIPSNLEMIKQDLDNIRKIMPGAKINVIFDY